MCEACFLSFRVMMHPARQSRAKRLTVQTSLLDDVTSAFRDCIRLDECAHLSDSRSPVHCQFSVSL